MEKSYTILSEKKEKTMSNRSAKKLITALLQLADVKVNGDRLWDITVHNENFYSRVYANHELGLGESYMAGWWDCPRLDMFFEHVLRSQLDTKLKANMHLLWHVLLSKLFNLQTKELSLEVGKKHYDLGNDLFRHMLDSKMNYTCGYWKNAQTLDVAQLAKLDLVCRKLLLKPGMRLLDIGCGWGALAKHAVEKFGVSVVGITISKEQYNFAKENCRGLPIEIRFQDYRDVQEQFDRICSLGMFEHVGHKNYHEYFKMVHRCLIDDGLFLLHTIGDNLTEIPNEWLTKYIFPHGALPSISLIAQATEGRWVMEDWHNFGPDYDKTLMAWHENFTTHWPQFKDHYNEYFYRMWNYYLLSCAGGFRARAIHLWQIVFSKYGIMGGYQAPR
jgi:cyclopropane-fatty-acyl-phospholipid synthase